MSPTYPLALFGLLGDEIHQAQPRARAFPNTCFKNKAHILYASRVPLFRVPDHIHHASARWNSAVTWAWLYIKPLAGNQWPTGDPVDSDHAPLDPGSARSHKGLQPTVWSSMGLATRYQTLTVFTHLAWGEDFIQVPRLGTKWTFFRPLLFLPLPVWAVAHVPRSPTYLFEAARASAD